MHWMEKNFRYHFGPYQNEENNTLSSASLYKSRELNKVGDTDYQRTIVTLHTAVMTTGIRSPLHRPRLLI